LCEKQPQQQAVLTYAYNNENLSLQKVFTANFIKPRQYRPVMS